MSARGHSRPDQKLKFLIVRIRSPHKHSIAVIDTEKMHETRAFKIGGSPALAIVAP
jgi:hypothetical protein